jgi:hypothetical protein
MDLIVKVIERDFIVKPYDWVIENHQIYHKKKSEKN